MGWVVPQWLLSDGPCWSAPVAVQKAVAWDSVGGSIWMLCPLFTPTLELTILRADGHFNEWSTPNLLALSVQTARVVVLDHSKRKGWTKGSTFLVCTFPPLKQPGTIGQMWLFRWALHEWLESTVGLVQMACLVALYVTANLLKWQEKHLTNHRWQICVSKTVLNRRIYLWMLWLRKTSQNTVEPWP